MDEMLKRTELLIGAEGIEKLKNSHVAIAGVGGVGSYAAEAMVRTGVGTVTIVDFDTVDVTNINRQIHALHSTVGKRKVKVMAERLADINPEAVIIAKDSFITADNVAELFCDKYDYIIDAVDNVTAKIALALYCREKRIPFISSMGTANKLDNTKFRICDLSETKVCPLARVMRHEMRKRGVEKGITVLYSEAEAMKLTQTGEGKPVPGSVMFVPAVGGLMLAGKVINDIINNQK